MNDHIPEQREGKALDYFKSVDFSSPTQSNEFFEEAKAKLFDVNNWHQIAQIPSAVFAIVDKTGHKLDRPIQEGDFIRIDIPGPGLPSAKGYDWVQVEEILEEQQHEMKRLTLTLRPCADPIQENTDTAHFFKRIATSSILIEQQARRLFFHYAGRNEVVNTDNISMLDNFRNFMVGLTAKIGASFPQWKALIDGLADTANIQLPDKITEKEQDY